MPTVCCRLVGSHGDVLRLLLGLAGAWLIPLAAGDDFSSRQGEVDGVQQQADGRLAAPLSAEVYGRAERFLSWNKDKYLLNADIRHHWIPGSDRFWYLRTNSGGEREFVVVDAATGIQTPAFDHDLIADALAAAAGKGIDPRRLPFSSFRYAVRTQAIEFTFENRGWTCQLAAGPSPCVREPHGIQDRAVSPDGKWRAFIRDHNLWLRAMQGDMEFPLTTDGIEHYGYASTPGYSTHFVTDQRRAKVAPQVAWSPDSRFVLSYRLDERRVQELALVESVPEDGSFRPKLHTFRYALAGDEHLPMLEPVVFDILARRGTRLATAPLVCSAVAPLEKNEMWWSADSESLYLIRRDRYSKSMTLLKAQAATGVVTALVQENSDTIVHTNSTNPFRAPVIRILSNGDIILYSERDGWGHLYRYDRTGKPRNRITRGEWGVNDIVRVDERTSRIYFTASGREAGRDPYEQYLYSIRMDGSNLRLLTPEEGDHTPLQRSPASSAAADIETAQFSPSGRYFVDSYSRPDLPPVFVLRAADGRLIRQLERADISKLRAEGYVPVEQFRVLAADGRTPIYGNLFRPSDFEPTRKYPLIDANYGGPQAVRSRKSFTAANFDSFEARSLAELGFFVVTIDGRGTPGRGKLFRDYSYGELHKASDLDDHIAAIRQLAQRHPSIDVNRVGIDGASGGGYMAARAILAYPEFYKVAVAAEGNYDQRGYLAPWGETYLGPAGGAGYLTSSITPLAGRLAGKLLLMHGEMDDNVHPAQTLRLVDALIKANKDFDLLILPGSDHAAAATSGYFIRRKWDYFVRNLLGREPPAGYAIRQI
jgi:dipeptidyl aminopeptidase/acylaminoacyl peptidase